MSARRLLVVTPSFPPSDAVDMHRVRMNVRHYADHGFVPTVLAVDPTQAGRIIDPRLCKTLPTELRVIRAAALPEAVMHRVGVRDVALRAWRNLARAGDSILRSEGCDLVFFSTTAFQLFTLGPRWLRRFGVPFVLDYQDPWAAAPATSIAQRRRGLKHSLMRSLHATAEARTAPHAAGLIAVSETYITVLQATYPSLAGVPTATIPFGYSPNDAITAALHGVPFRPFATAADAPCVAAYAGRIGSDMDPALSALFAAMTTAERDALAPLDCLHLTVLGTGYQRTGNPERVLPRARAAGLAKRVAEHPDRVSLVDSLATLLSADILLVFGSNDLSYQPSKLYQLMAMRKPILCLAPAASRLARQVRDLRSVVFLPSDDSPRPATLRNAANQLGALLATPAENSAYDERTALCAGYTAATLAARECALFQRAIAHHVSRGGRP